MLKFSSGQYPWLQAFHLLHPNTKKTTWIVLKLFRSHSLFSFDLIGL